MSKISQGEEDDFFELPDEIPFAKITKFEVESVEQTGEGFLIHIYMKCEGIPEEENGHKIVRSFQDLAWLIEALHRESPQVGVLPLIRQPSYWSSLKELANTFEKGEKKERKKHYDNIFICSSIKRSFQILSRISLPHLYKLGSIQSSLFIFLSEKYKLYKMESYQKEKAPQGGSILQFGQKAVFRFISGFMPSGREQFSKEKQILSAKAKEVEQLNQDFIEYDSTLKALVNQFFNHRAELQKKQLNLWTFMFQSQNLLKTIKDLQEEIAQVEKLIQEAKNKAEERQINKQIGEYRKFLKADLEKIQREKEKICKYYIESLTENTVSINMKDIFPSSK